MVQMAFTGKVIVYYRVSTAHQGIGGLGIEAQRTAVQAYLYGGGDWEIIAEFTEVESGRRSDRPPAAKGAGEGESA
jgi:DNA invertase Pin-like site-specific DNA recombinase